MTAPYTQHLLHRLTSDLDFLLSQHALTPTEHSIITQQLETASDRVGQAQAAQGGTGLEAAVEAMSVGGGAVRSEGAVGQQGQGQGKRAKATYDYAGSAVSRCFSSSFCCCDEREGDAEVLQWG
jgi:hypothetical protein